MAEVIDFQAKIIKKINTPEELKEEKIPEGYFAGMVVCLNCQRTWTAVAPGDTEQLECPSCHTFKGVWMYPFRRPDEEHFRCRCGNIYFCLTPTTTYCPNCGRKHTF